MNLDINVRQKFQTSWTPIFLFVLGVSFCAFIRVINVSLMVSFSIPDLHYYISKPFCGISYVWICESILGCFIILGVVELLKEKQKIFSVALIISCISIAINLVLMESGSKRGHVDEINSLARHIETKMSHMKSDPELQYFYLEHKYRYSKHVDHWNELEKENITPIDGIYLNDEERKKMLKYRSDNYVDFQ